jgi:hypothetical protein
MIDTIDVPLGRPRDYDVVTSPEFVDLKRRIMGSLHDEVNKALAAA